MKKLTAFVAIISILLPFFNVVKVEASYNRYFVVTAYYSPLPGQDYYLKGNFEAEKRLNWNWTHGASWRWVFEGMLAAPKNYSFWTMIQLEGVWVWVVADRWGAIVNAGQRWYSHDRIDIWMGYWDEGLKRALQWGKRTIRGKIVGYDRNATGSIDVHKFPSPKNATSKLSPASSIYSKGIGIGSSTKNIKELQTLLKGKGIYTWSIDWKYNKKLISEVVDFQIANNLIKTPYDYGAWYWGTKTRAMVKDMPFLWNEIKATETDPNKTKTVTKDSLESIFAYAVWPYSSENDVKKLQEVLKKIGKYKWEINWKYDKEFKKSLIDYQLEIKVIITKNDNWAWYFGPKTREQAKVDYWVYKAIEAQKIARLDAEKKAKELKEKMEKEMIAKSNINSEKVMDAIWKPSVWSVGQNVRVLQKTLAYLGHFNTKDSAIYGQVTKNAITKFQVKNNVIESEKSDGAWYFWPKTRRKMKEVLARKFYDDQKTTSKSLAFAIK